MSPAHGPIFAGVPDAARPARLIRVGCAGWAIPKELVDRFPSDGTHLARYARRFPMVEINSSFYRPHRPATYARWAESVPDEFRFAVKVPRAATHERRLIATDDILDRFHNEVSQLGVKLGPLLVQLPPSLVFAPDLAKHFFASLRERFAGAIVFEPRHASWFAPAVELLVATFRIARVAADPAVVPLAARPGGWDWLVYYRLHGSPRMYYSAYSAKYLGTLARNLTLAAGSAEVWCVFDNTAEGAAAENAMQVMAKLTGDK